MTIDKRIVELAEEIGKDYKGLNTKIGVVDELTKKNKNTLAQSIDERHKIALSYTDELVKKLKNEITNGASDSMDTFFELAEALNNDSNFASKVAIGLSKRVRFDSIQNLTTEEKLQACSNMGIGNPDVDFVQTYKKAKGER